MDLSKYVGVAKLKRAKTAAGIAGRMSARGQRGFGGRGNVLNRPTANRPAGTARRARARATANRSFGQRRRYGTLQSQRMTAEATRYRNR